MCPGLDPGVALPILPDIEACPCRPFGSLPLGTEATASATAASNIGNGTLNLYLYVNSCWKIQVCKRFHHSLVRFENINKPFVHSHLKLLSGVFMNKSGPVHGVFVYFRRQRHRPRNLGAEALDRFHDLPGALIQNLAVVRLELYPHFLRNLFFLRLFLLFCWHLKKNWLAE